MSNGNGNGGNGTPKVESAEHVEHAKTVAVAVQVDGVDVNSKERFARRWYWPITFFTVAILGGTLMLVGALVITIQRADRAERAVGEAEQAVDSAEQAVDKAERSVDKARVVALEDQERGACYARYVALTFDRSFVSRSDLNQAVIELFAVLAISPASEEDIARLETTINDLRADDLLVREAIQQRKDYIAAGQPLPCPLSSTLQPTGE